MDMEKWPSFSPVFANVQIDATFFREKIFVDILAESGGQQIHCTAKILTYQPKHTLVFERQLGPLPGKSELKIVANGNGSLLEYTTIYYHTLGESLKDSLAHTMEKFLTDFKNAV